jgi:CRISPR/Cas system-associated exonuclease Cas4 (RecB family)
MNFSHSSISTYEDCPLKYKLTRINHLPEPTGPAAERGKRIHKEFEEAFGGLGLVTTELEPWLDFINDIKSYYTIVLPEFDAGVRRDWSPCGFKDDDVWLRGQIDLLAIKGNKARIVDWKTGKERDYEKQLRLYATLVFALYPSVDTIELELVFIDLQKPVTCATVIRKDFSLLKTWMTNRMLKIEKDSIFAPKPNSNCKYCHFRKDNGGPCKW